MNETNYKQDAPKDPRNLSMLVLLQGMTRPTTATIEKLKHRGEKYPKEFKERVRRIIIWLVKWNTAVDCMQNGLLANGIKFDSTNYVCQTHALIRKQMKLSPPEKHWRYAKAKEMEKMGATFEEIYFMWWGGNMDNKLDPFRKSHLKRMLSGIRN